MNSAEEILKTVNNVSIVLLILIVIFSVIMLWKIFVKAGKKGWIALVPVYNFYTLYEITWGNGWYFLLGLVAIIPIIGMVAFLVINAITYVKLGKAFGKSTGFNAGLVLLTPIFEAILAFDSSQYVYVKNNNVNSYNNQYYNPQPDLNQQSQNTNINTQTAQPVNNQAVTFCTNCGTQFDQNSAFCTNCGKPRS